MSATSRDRGAHDDNHIDVREEAERRRWGEKFGVSAEKLRAAIDAVGPRAEDVERYLRDRAEASRFA